MIEITKLNKVFELGERRIHALNDINLFIPKGKVFGVIGASGAGKSTLIRMVNLLERPTSGSVKVGGVNLTALSNRDLTQARRQIGMIFQHFNLLSSRSVFDNIALPLELSGASSEEIETRVTELLDLVGLADKRHVYPASLSGGQKQRVAIAGHWRQALTFYYVMRPPAHWIPLPHSRFCHCCKPSTKSSTSPFC